MSGEAHPSEALHALHDGRLEGPERAGVEEHLRSCERCQSELEALRALSGVAREASGAAPPEGLEERLHRSLDGEDRRRRGRTRWTVGAVAAVVVAVTVALWVGRSSRSPDWPALALATQEQLERGQLVLDVEERRPERLEAALRQRGASVRVLDLAMMGLELVGGSVREVGGRPVALIAYRDARGRILLCQMFPGAGVRLPPPIEERRRGELVFNVYRQGPRTAVFWREGPVLCALVGTAPGDEVIALAMQKAR